MQLLIERLKQNKIKHTLLRDDKFLIDNVGTFLFVDNEEYQFDDDFNLLAEHEDGIDFYAFKFGGEYYYTKETNNVTLTPLKNIGEYLSESNIDFVNLGIHSSYELLNANGNYKNYIQKAKFLKHDTVGVCEYNTLAGLVAFQIYFNEKGINTVIGYTTSLKLADNVYRDIKLYVTDNISYRNLLRVNSIINVFNSENKYITLDDLSKYSKNLICVLSTDFDFKYLDKIQEMEFKDIFYQVTTIQYKSTKKDLEVLQEQKTYIAKYSDKIKPVLIDDAYYVDKSDSRIKKLLNAVGNIKFQNESSEQYYKSIDDIIPFSKLFSDNNIHIFYDAIKNTRVIADYCKDFKIDLKSMKLPKYYPKKEDIGFVDAESFLRSIISKNFDKLIKGKVDDEQIYYERIEKELDIIRRGGFIDYFLILWDIIQYCRDNNILTGVGRGSAGGSLISYLLEIIYLDPIKYDLYFERFLNEGRFDSVPDIDCDFEGLKRDDVKKYMERRFGENNVASIGTYNTLKIKAALKDLGRVMNYDVKTINIITSYLGDDMEGTGDNIVDFFKAACVNHSVKKFIVENPELINNCMIALNNKRTQSIHAAGVIISPKYDNDGNPVEIYDQIPVKLDKSGVLISEWEGIYLDKCKFVKEDILGIAQLDKFQYILTLIKDQLGVNIDIHRDIPLDDEKTYELFKLGLNDDVFQFGSDSQKKYSIEVQPENIEHLIAMNALYRPGPIESNAHIDFYKIKRGEKDPEIDVGMDNITGNTYGLWVYQEQLMAAYRLLTDCDMTETDNFRKVTSKFAHYKKLGMQATEADKYHDNFIQGYINKFGVTEEYAESVWGKILSFIQYGFNKSHATAYAITGYYCQYLKANYPLQFWTASLHFALEKDINKRISELLVLNDEISLSSPDINYSKEKIFSSVETNKLYWSFTKVKFCGDTAVQKIIEERNNNGDYFSFEDFISRVPKKNINKRTVIYLILSGCFDDIENIKKPQERLRLIKKIHEINNATVPDEFLKIETTKEYWWQVKQKESCGFANINYENLLRINNFSNPCSAQKFLVKDKEILSIGGIVVEVKERKSRNAGTYLNLIIESNFELIKITIWNDAYEQYREILKNCLNNIILINGVCSYNNYSGQNTLSTFVNTKIKILKI